MVLCMKFAFPLLLDNSIEICWLFVGWIKTMSCMQCTVPFWMIKIHSRLFVCLYYFVGEISLCTKQTWAKTLKLENRRRVIVLTLDVGIFTTYNYYTHIPTEILVTNTELPTNGCYPYSVSTLKANPIVYTWLRYA